MSIRSLTHERIDLPSPYSEIQPQPVFIVEVARVAISEEAVAPETRLARYGDRTTGSLAPIHSLVEQIE